ncbi:MAG TPA: FAD-dependent oxidoreductase, partial [Clostridiales bacterium]|nr:FAD-dependent oxidoreductase [Clostridiales bacterium]
AVAIDDVKHFLAELDLNQETRYIPKATIPSLKGGFEEKIAIIGAGPAGLSCAYYLALTGYKPTIFERNEEPGGMLRYGIPSFKLEKDLLAAEIDIIRELGVEIRCGVEVGKDVTIEELRKQGYKGFYFAIGCQAGRKPGIPGQDADGAYAAVEFLREAEAKESFALTGDVVVVGGGNVAIDAARVSSRCTDHSISMYCLEQRTEMPASPEEIAEAEAENISVNCGWGPKEVLNENGKVTGVVFKKCLSVFNEEGRFAPTYDEDDTITIPCKHVIFSVGQAADWGGLLDGLKVDLRPNGICLANKLTYQTSEPDVFVGGDVYSGPKFAIDAIAAGREGAISLHRYVHEHCTLTIGRNRRDFIELDKDNIKVGAYDTSKRQIPNHASEAEQAATFRDLSSSLTEDQVKKETSRCLSCGASVVDPNKCIGCGICTTKCVFDAIKLHRELPGASTMRTSEEKLKYILPNMAKQSIKVKFKKRQHS